MFCSKCGANIPEGASFCSKCGNAVEKIDRKETKEKPKKSKIKKFLICVIILLFLISAVLLTPIIKNKINEMKTTEMLNILSDGYWMAMDSENKINMLDYDYDNDFGLIFYTKSYGLGDRLAITTFGECLSYTPNRYEDEGWNLGYWKNGVCNNFYDMEYDKENDMLILTKVLDDDFFDANMEVGTKIYLTHFRDKDENTKLEKKLYFEYWSDVDGDYSGTQKTIMKNLFSDDPGATMYRFFKNKNRQFNYCDVSLFEYTCVSEFGYVHTLTNYDFSGEYQYNGLNMVGLSFNDSTFEYFRYDEEENCLINDSNGRKIYCVSNNTESDWSITNK